MFYPFSRLFTKKREIYFFSLPGEVLLLVPSDFISSVWVRQQYRTHVKSDIVTIW